MYVGSIVLVTNLVMLTIRGNGCVKVSNSHFHIVVATHSCDTCCLFFYLVDNQCNGSYTELNGHTLVQYYNVIVHWYWTFVQKVVFKIDG